MSGDGVDSPKLVAGVVLLKPNGAVLLQHRDNKPGLTAAGQWVFPGGGCEDGETFETAAVREFREETGYECDGIHPLTTFLYRLEENGRNYQITFFWSLYDEVQPVQCFEGQEVRFVERDTASSYATPDYQI